MPRSPLDATMTSSGAQWTGLVGPVPIRSPILRLPIRKFGSPNMFIASGLPYLTKAGPIPIVCASSEKDRSARSRLVRCRASFAGSAVGRTSRPGSLGCIIVSDTALRLERACRPRSAAFRPFHPVREILPPARLSRLADGLSRSESCWPSAEMQLAPASRRRDRLADCRARRDRLRCACEGPVEAPSPLARRTSPKVRNDSSLRCRRESAAAASSRRPSLRAACSMAFTPRAPASEGSHRRSPSSIRQSHRFLPPRSSQRRVGKAGL